MIRSRFSLLGVLVVAMGLMAFFASAAQAEVGAQWLVLEKPGVLLTEAQILANNTKLEVLEVENKTISLLSEVGTTKIDFLCTSLSFIDALLNATGGVKEGAKLQFTGCKSLSGGTNGLEKESMKCAPKTNGGPLGTIETLPLHALLKLHEKADTLLILPDNGTQEFAVIELGATCAFGEEFPIFGNLSLQDCGGTTKWLEHLLSHLLNEFAPLTTLSLFAPRGKAGAKNAAIDGSVLVRLNTDELWSGDPG